MTIRKVEPEDMNAIILLMTAFAKYDGSSNELSIDKASLSKAYFENPSLLNGIVALVDNEIVGFANFYFTFSSYTLRKCLWVEDAFVLSEYRGHGIGKELFHKIHEISNAEDCCRVDWLVRRHNLKGREFYKKLGAQIKEDTIHVQWIS